MKREVSLGAAALAMLIAAGSAQAAPIVLSLSSLDDLSNLTVGQTVAIDVSLDGLDELNGEQLGYLAATVEFDSTIFGTPFNLLEGPIVPDSSGALPALSPGVADFFYDELFAASGDPISSNGLFYSFNLQVVGGGTGTIEIVFQQAAAPGIFPPDDIPPGPSNSLPVVAQASVVPEPSALLIWTGLGLVVAAGRRGRQWLRKADA